jgi:hypothetical protein
MERLHDQLADVSESGGGAGRDAVIRCGSEEFGKGAVDGKDGVEVAIRADDFFGDEFGVLELEILQSVLSAEGLVIGCTRRLTASAVGGAMGAAGSFIY